MSTQNSNVISRIIPAFLENWSQNQKLVTLFWLTSEPSPFDRFVSILEIPWKKWNGYFETFRWKIHFWESWSSLDFKSTWLKSNLKLPWFQVDYARGVGALKVRMTEAPMKIQKCVWEHLLKKLKDVWRSELLGEIPLKILNENY